MADAKTHNGALEALCHKGSQDARVAKTQDADVLAVLTGDGYFQVVYDELEYSVERNAERNNVSFTLDSDVTCYVNMLDLVIGGQDSKQIGLNDMIKCIQVDLNGFRVDRIFGDDIETYIKTQCAVFGRKINRIGDKLFVPLATAPLHKPHVVRGFGKWGVRIMIELHESFQPTDIKLYGQKYLFSQPTRDLTYEFTTVQSQYFGEEKLTRGINKIRVNYNHPTALIYFWGFDKTKVKRVGLELNGHWFYEGSIDALEHVKRSRGYDVDPTFLFFSCEEDVQVVSKSSINFSRIDHAYLVIETDEEECDLHMVGLVYHCMRYANELYALMFSK